MCGCTQISAAVILTFVMHGREKTEAKITGGEINQTNLEHIYKLICIHRLSCNSENLFRKLNNKIMKPFLCTYKNITNFKHKT